MFIGFLTEQVFGTHDAGTVENDVKFGESLGDVGGKRLDCRAGELQKSSMRLPPTTG